MATSPVAYHQRLAVPNDAGAIAPIWKEFVAARAEADPSIQLKQNFDYIHYVKRQIEQPLSFGFLLECREEIVGFLFIYIYDEAPPPQITALEMFENPFLPRRVGSVLGMYVKEEHRQPQPIHLLVEAAIRKVEDLKVTDIDLLISQEQTGIHALVERLGFTKAAIQYTRHYEISNRNLPDLRPVDQNTTTNFPQPKKIPLRDPQTHDLVRNPRGEEVFLDPLKDDAGTHLISSSGLPIYPIPVRDPQTQEWVFNEDGDLVVCPIRWSEEGRVAEIDGIPQFHLPTYEYIDGKLTLKKNQDKFLFNV
jgi:hypothetical protein